MKSKPQSKKKRHSIKGATMTTRTKGDKWLSYDQVIYWTKLSRRTIDRLVAADKFPLPVKNGGRKVFVKREIFTWMETQENRRKASA